MAEADGQEKTEQATGKKLGDARDRGEVAKSMEINSLAVFGSGLTMIYLTKSFLGEQLSTFSTDIFRNIATMKLNANLVQEYMINWALILFTLLGPVLLAIVVISIISNVSQVGFKFTSKAMKPTLGKFNPISGIKRILFSPRSLLEILKSIVKLTIIVLFAYYVIEGMIPDTIGLVNLSLEDTVEFMLNSAFTMIWKIVLFFSVIAAADFIYQKMKFKKEMMMTKVEVKEENKQTEGDPHVKSKQRQKMFQTARRRMMKDVPTADVVITNPTHFAIALKYDLQKDGAPKVVAKGTDELAQRIKKIATENNVPLYEDRELARALYKACDIGDEIPANLFKAVAQILAYIFSMRKMKKRKSIV